MGKLLIIDHVSCIHLYMTPLGLGLTIQLGADHCELITERMSFLRFPAGVHCVRACSDAWLMEDVDIKSYI